jgi:putative heme-binding domain-containing protein
LLPAETVRPLFRQQWNNLALRDDLLLKLAQTPEPADREKYLWGLDSAQPPVVRAALTALLQLPRDTSDKTVFAALRLLRRLLGEPREQVLRTQALTLVNTETGQRFNIQGPVLDAASLKSAYQPVFDWFAQKQPALIRRLDAEDQEDSLKWDRFLKTVPWDRGNAANGEAIFRARGCATCHTLTTALGPELSGVTSRLSQRDVFDAILFPSREVAGPYKMTSFQTRDGSTYIGLVAFQSADGVILQTGATTTVRLAEADIVSRQPSNFSLMPSGLLSGLKALDLADLYAYLKTLQPRER